MDLNPVERIFDFQLESPMATPQSWTFYRFLDFSHNIAPSKIFIFYAISLIFSIHILEGGVLKSGRTDFWYLAYKAHGRILKLAFLSILWIMVKIQLHKICYKYAYFCSSSSFTIEDSIFFLNFCWILKSWKKIL
jgi:hypothetical protein